MEGLGGNHCHQRRPGQHHRAGQVQEHDKGKNADRRQRRNEQLRQILAEIGLQLLDAIDHRQNDIARSLQPEKGRPQFDNLCIKLFADMHLNRRRSFMRNHVADIFKPAPQQHDRGNRHEGYNQRFEAGAVKYLCQQPAKQGQSGHADGRGNKPNDDGPEYPQPYALRELPKPTIEIHALTPDAPNGLSG